tara:strand:- start:84 stop:752 length:669 start_codon:yes stop_codon:yes gene_type:complete
MASIKLTGDSSGVITVSAPAAAGTNTLTLPATTGTVLDTNSALVSSKLTGALPAIDGSALTGIGGGSGSILQMKMLTPDPGLVTTTNTTFAETTSTLRLAITPQSASSTLVLTISFMFGGGNSSQLSYFKFYDYTNSADVNLGSAGTRQGCHGGARQVDTDDNDTDSIQFATTVASGSTAARTYTMYNRKEGSDAAYFFANLSNSSVLGYAKPTFTIMEVAG